jgi:nucleotide-binding universal stress UspA family protein
MESHNFQLSAAKDDFERERRIAAMQEILSYLTGKPTDLLSFSDVSRSLHRAGGSDRGLQDIPVDAIIGSVGRYHEFTRTFLPRQDADIDRWSRVKAAMIGDPFGLPPIEVYQVGEAYFVIDGHHRVSVARQLHMKQIQAHVTEVRTRVPLTTDATADELVAKAEYADFLERTGLQELFSGIDFTLSIPGLYSKLEEHIRVHRYFMGLDQKREIPIDEAIKDWYEKLYSPVVEIIRRRGILRDFPGRTNTDLYLWISEHRYLLEKELGLHVRSDVAAVDLTKEMSPTPGRIFDRLKQRLMSMALPKKLEENLQPGEWLQTRKLEKGERLFAACLVPVSGSEASWLAVEQALELSHRENTSLNGLHVVTTEENLVGSEAQVIRDKFEQMCHQAGVTGAMVVAQGDIAEEIVTRAPFYDLVVINIAHPPDAQVRSRLTSGLGTIIRRCSCPILAVTGQTSTLDRILLAYDGSIKAREALYLSAYLAKKWNAYLMVLTSIELGRKPNRTLKYAQDYLTNKGVNAEYAQKVVSEPGESILEAAKQHGCNLILMGGYGYTPLFEVMLGSSVDVVLRKTEIPVLICQ